MLELIHTSVPQGLKENTSGFCSVAWTAGIPANLIPPLEQLSAYRALYPFGDFKYELNPVAIAYLRIRYGGNTLSILSRIASAGLDYSGRSNKIAHLILLEKNEIAAPDFSPVALCRNHHTFFTEWNRPPEELPPRHIIAPRELLRPAVNWGNLAGSPAWAGVIAENFLQNPSKSVYVEYPEGFSTSSLLLLVAEITSLLTKEQETDFTFNTYFTSLPNGGACFLRFCPKGSPVLRSAERVASTPIIRLMEKNRPLPEQENSFWGIYARTGTPPQNPHTAPKKNDPLPEQLPVPESKSDIPLRTESNEKKRDPHQDYLQAENLVLRTRLEQSRRKQQLILGIAILTVVAIAAIAIMTLLFSRNDPPPEIPKEPETSIEQINVQNHELSTVTTSVPPESPKVKNTEQETAPEPSPKQKQQSAAPQTKTSPPPEPPPKQNPDKIVKNKISVPSGKSLFAFLEQLAAKMNEEKTFSSQCSLPPELSNAKDLSVRLNSIGGNTAEKITGNLAKYIQKIPGGVRILSTANIPKDGIYDYVPVPESFLELTIENRTLHIARKISRSASKIDTPHLADISVFTFKGSQEISIPFTLTEEMLFEVPFGRLERGSESRYDFTFSSDSKQPYYFIYRKSPEEEHLSHFITCSFVKQDTLFLLIETWNAFQRRRSKTSPQEYPEAQKLLQKLSELQKHLSGFEKYKSFYKDTDPVTFGGIRSCRDMEQADKAAKTFLSRKKQYEDFMSEKEKQSEEKLQEKEKQFFQTTRELFLELQNFNAVNRNLLREIIAYNKLQDFLQNQNNIQSRLQKNLLKELQNRAIPDEDKKKIENAVSGKQQITLFRNGPNRNKALEEFFTRTWVVRTVKQERK